MLITMAALGRAMIDAPLVADIGPGPIAIGGIGVGAFFGGNIAG